MMTTHLKMIIKNMNRISSTGNLLKKAFISLFVLLIYYSASIAKGNNNSFDKEASFKASFYHHLQSQNTDSAIL